MRTQWFVLTLLLFAVVILPHVSYGAVFCPCCMDKNCPNTPCPVLPDQQCTCTCTPNPGGMPCPATQCTQGDGKSDPASKGGAEKMAEMAQKLMEMLQKKGGGGGGAPPPPGEEKEKEDPNAFDNVLGSIFGATSTATSTEDRTQQILDSIGENFGDSAITTEVRAIAEEIAGTAVSVTAINDIATSGSTSTATTGSGKNNIVGSTAPFTPPQSQSSASKNNNGITGSSVFGNSGVGAFFGVISNAVESAAQASARFVTQVCTNRPWDNTIVSTVFTTGFFDNLCVSRGYAPPPPRATKNTTDTAGGVGRASISCPRSGSRGAPFTITWACPTGRQSGGIGFTTNGLNSGAAVVSATSTREYVLECSDGTKDRCTVEVGVPKTDLTASPAFVQLGGRSRLYWTSEGVQSCELTGVGMRQEGLTGAAMSPSIYDRSTFTVTCRTADGETVKDTTIVDIGL